MPDPFERQDFTCPRCGATSHHPMDAAEGYCGACHDWTGPGFEVEINGVMCEFPRHLNYDRDGNPITLRRWCELREGDIGDQYLRVANDPIVGPDGAIWWLSTVWLGLDFSHDFRDPHVPMIFETMLFDGDGSGGEQWRWATEAAALAGHERILAELRDTWLKSTERGTSEA